MKKSIKSLVHKLRDEDLKQLEGGFAVLSRIRGGTVDPSNPSLNDNCPNTTNNIGCSNKQCSGSTNTYACHNYNTCFTD